jgi:hypothetical protein
LRIGRIRFGDCSHPISLSVETDYFVVIIDFVDGVWRNDIFTTFAFGLK